MNCKNEIILQLPLQLTKNLFIDWIDVVDICHIDHAYLNEINRNKIKIILNGLLVFGLEEIIYDEFYNTKIVELKQNL